MPADGDSKITLVLLPGMDGTGRLFEDFTAVLAASIDPVVISYPVDQPLDHTELEALIEQQLPAEGRFVLLGESFSGPLAVRIAARGHTRLAAVVLVASFSRNPLTRAGKWLRPLIGSWCFRIAPPRWLIRRFLAGSDTPADLLVEFQAAVQACSPAVMARRAKDVLSTDVRHLLPQIAVPILLLSANRDRLVASTTRTDFDVLEDRFERVAIDAPHLILQRRPAEAAQAIEEFLNRRLSTGETGRE